VLVLNRPRHADLIGQLRHAGARIRLIQDGDVAGVIATTRPETGIDIYMGIGGAPEGVLAAAALQCIGGQFQGKLRFRNDDEKARAAKMGIHDLNKTYAIDELAHGDIFFSATGVTDGWMLRGVHRHGDRVQTESIVMRSRSGTVRKVAADHNLARKTYLLEG
jgi:fructose-1,6-bisphosphatase II / sedoheptulose-1,7-bisphosphatase